MNVYNSNIRYILLERVNSKPKASKLLCNEQIEIVTEIFKFSLEANTIFFRQRRHCKIEIISICSKRKQMRNLKSVRYILQIKSTQMFADLQISRLHTFSCTCLICSFSSTISIYMSLFMYKFMYKNFRTGIL